MSDTMVPAAGAPGRLQRLDLAAVRRWAVTARASLDASRADLDALNVYPVPDGDTGTNLYLTLDAALEAVRAQDGSDLGTAVTAFARATLLSARGNSGVIASQLARGVSDVCRDLFAAEGRADLDGPGLARALRRAWEHAYAGVSRPVEGTMLTVAAAAADGAGRAAAAGADLYAVTRAALDAARAALAGTTGQLPALERAGVVDAGGAGYVVLLEALEHVVSGEGPSPTVREGRTRALPQPGAAHDAGTVGGPAYEVMFLLDSHEAAVPTLRERLDELGDSVLVVGGPDVWNVHAHVDDVGAALEAGMAAGRPHRVAVTRFDSQRQRQHAGSVAVVACAAGDGLAEVLRSAGASVVTSDPGRRVSTTLLLEAARASGAGSTLLLPDGAESLLAAEAAASAACADGLDVRVVRTRGPVHAIAAMAVFDAGRGVSENLLAMTSAAAATRQGAVRTADHADLTSAGPCRPGDALGLIEGAVVVVGEQLGIVALEVAQRLLAGGGELLTVLTGAGAPDGLAEAVVAGVRRHRPDVEVTVVPGGHPAWPLLMGVE